MTDAEIIAYLALTPEQAEKALPRITPELRSLIERMCGLTKEIDDAIAGIAPPPRGVLLDFPRRKRSDP